MLSIENEKYLKDFSYYDTMAEESIPNPTTIFIYNNNLSSVTTFFLVIKWEFIQWLFSGAAMLVGWSESWCLASPEKEESVKHCTAKCWKNGSEMGNVYTWEKNIIVQWRPGWRVQKYSLKCVGMRCQGEWTALPAPWLCQWKESGRGRAALIIWFFINVNRVCSVLSYFNWEFYVGR